MAKTDQIEASSLAIALNAAAADGYSLRWLQEIKDQLNPQALEMLRVLVEETAP